MNRFSVALDGPAGAGKSTIAKLLANELKCTYIDTGAMYRSVGLYCIKNEIDYTIEQDVVKSLDKMTIECIYTKGKQHVYLNGEEVNQQIRVDEVARAASKVATYEKVREALVSMQRALAAKESVVMDGRDIGTVVLPHATLKVFLTADVLERAKRRHLEYYKKNIQVPMEEIIEEMKNRDKQDMERAVSPLKKADDAVEIDTTGKSLGEIIQEIVFLLKEKSK